jgi:glutamyl-tRNA synthetase
VELSDFFFQDITAYEEKPVQKIWRAEDAAQIMAQLTACLESVTDWNRDVLKQAFHDLGESMGVGMGKLVHPARLALTGKSVGPGLFELAELLGKEACLNRMRKASAFVATLN